MHQCKHARKKAVHKHTTSKLLISLLAMALVCCVTISGTLAWMLHQTEPVVNTFTYGDIQITLEETDAVKDGAGYTNHYAIAPGIDITKDPTVTVKAGSEDCWLFVQLAESDNFGEYLRYEAEDGWDKLRLNQNATTGGVYVYYRTVAQHDTDQAYNVLKDNTVQVKTTVTKEKLDALDDADKYPTLTITAYAVQQEGIVDESITNTNEQALEAWELIARAYLE